MKHDYTQLDSAIIEFIRHNCGHAKFASMTAVSAKPMKHARLIAGVENTGKPVHRHTETWRIVDRRLQALRKAGKIVFIDQARGWDLVERASK